METYEVLVYPRTYRQFRMTFTADGGTVGAIRKLRSLVDDSTVRFLFLGKHAS